MFFYLLEKEDSDNEKMERTNTHQMYDNDQFRHVRDRHNNNTTSQTAGIRLLVMKLPIPSTINRPQPTKTVINNRVIERPATGYSFYF